MEDWVWKALKGVFWLEPDLSPTETEDERKKIAEGWIGSMEEASQIRLAEFLEDFDFFFVNNSVKQ